MIYSDYSSSAKPHAVVGGKLVPIDADALHVLAVNAMALAVAMPSSAPSSASAKRG